MLPIRPNIHYVAALSRLAFNDKPIHVNHFS